MSKLFATVASIVLSATFMFAAQATEYAGLEYMTFAAGLAIAAVVGILFSAGLVISMFRRSKTSSMLSLALLIGTMPFLVDWTLRANHTQLNVHGIAMMGFLGYAALSELCFLSMMAAAIVRAAYRARSRP